MFTKKMSGLVLALAMIFIASAALAEWNNPLPEMVKESGQSMDVLFSELKEKYNFPFDDIRTISPVVLQNYINNSANNLPTDEVSKIYELINIMETYVKALYFYHEGEQYLRRLEDLGWTIHYNDARVFDTMYREFREKWISLTQMDFDQQGNEVMGERVIEMSFDKICISIPNGELEYPNPAITAILKDNPELKIENEFPEKGVIFYLRGFQPSAEPMSKAIAIELRWLDENGQKHIVWNGHLPYPLPIFLIANNTLY